MENKRTFIINSLNRQAVGLCCFFLHHQALRHETVVFSPPLVTSYFCYLFSSLTSQEPCKAMSSSHLSLPFSSSFIPAGPSVKYEPPVAHWSHTRLPLQHRYITDEAKHSCSAAAVFPLVSPGDIDYCDQCHHDAHAVVTTSVNAGEPSGGGSYKPNSDGLGFVRRFVFITTEASPVRTSVTLAEEDYQRFETGQVF